MTITLTALTKSLKMQSPTGIELPRDPERNDVHMPTIQRWVEDACGLLNAARRRTTLKETTITITADVQDYELPDAAREVVRIDRDADAPSNNTRILDIPFAQPPFLGYGSFGSLPSGQEISPAIDLINRQRVVRNRREDSWQMFDGQIRFLFPCTEGEKVRVTYRVIDRSLANLPDDYYSHVLLYLRIQNLEFYLERNSAQIVSDGDRLLPDRIASLTRTKFDLATQWTGVLNSIAPAPGPSSEE